MFSFTNPNNVAMTYSFSLSETTMFSTWTKFVSKRECNPNCVESGLTTYSTYSFINTTNADSSFANWFHFRFALSL